MDSVHAHHLGQRRHQVQRMQFYNFDHLSSREVSFQMSDIQHKHECTCWIALQVLMCPNNVWTLEQDHT